MLRLVHVPLQENMKHERHLEVKESTSTKLNKQGRRADAATAAVLVDKVSSFLTVYAITYA